MAYRTRRQKRYEYWSNRGFLKVEAAEFSGKLLKDPRYQTLRAPYIKNMITGRARILARAKREEWPIEKYKQYIKGIAKKNGWMKLTRTGKKVLDPWRMLRDFEERFRERHPEYESPWELRRKRFKDFQSKFEKGIEKYPRGRVYKSRRAEYAEYDAFWGEVEG